MNPQLIRSRDRIVVNLVYGTASPHNRSGLPQFVAARAYKVRKITVRPVTLEGSALTATVKKAASATALTSGTTLHSGTADLNAGDETNQVLTLDTTAGVTTIPSGTAIGLVFSTTCGTAEGVVSVELEPATM